MNTGPDSVTSFLNKADYCFTYPSVYVYEGLIRGPVTHHHQSGTWRNEAAQQRRKATAHEVSRLDSYMHQR